jgi:hypothetical protein
MMALQTLVDCHSYPKLQKKQKYKVCKHFLSLLAPFFHIQLQTIFLVLSADKNSQHAMYEYTDADSLLSFPR